MSAHSPGSNCEEDYGDGCLTSYSSLFETYQNEYVGTTRMHRSWEEGCWWVT